MLNISQVEGIQDNRIYKIKNKLVFKRSNSSSTQWMNLLKKLCTFVNKSSICKMYIISVISSSKDVTIKIKSAKNN